jgi:hypothetical protein
VDIDARINVVVEIEADAGDQADRREAGARMPSRRIFHGFAAPLGWFKSALTGAPSNKPFPLQSTGPASGPTSGSARAIQTHDAGEGEVSSDTACSSGRLRDRVQFVLELFSSRRLSTAAMLYAVAACVMR